MASKTTFPGFAAFVLSAAVFVFVPHEQHTLQQGAPRPSPERKTIQRIYAPLPNGSWLDGELVLNNNSPDVRTVRPTFFGNGIGAAGTPVMLQPAEVR